MVYLIGERFISAATGRARSMPGLKRAAICPVSRDTVSSGRIAPSEERRPVFFTDPLVFGSCH
jgi:hypothetical protein